MTPLFKNSCRLPAKPAMDAALEIQTPFPGVIDVAARITGRLAITPAQCLSKISASAAITNGLPKRCLASARSSSRGWNACANKGRQPTPCANFLSGVGRAVFFRSKRAERGPGT